MEKGREVRIALSGKTVVEFRVGSEEEERLARKLVELVGKRLGVDVGIEVDS